MDKLNRILDNAPPGKILLTKETNKLLRMSDERFFIDNGLTLMSFYVRFVYKLWVPLNPILALSRLDF